MGWMQIAILVSGIAVTVVALWFVMLLRKRDVPKKCAVGPGCGRASQGIHLLCETHTLDDFLRSSSGLRNLSVIKAGLAGTGTAVTLVLGVFFFADRYGSAALESPPTQDSDSEESELSPTGSNPINDDVTKEAVETGGDGVSSSSTSSSAADADIAAETTPVGDSQTGAPAPTAPEPPRVEGTQQEQEPTATVAETTTSGAPTTAGAESATGFEPANTTSTSETTAQSEPTTITTTTGTTTTLEPTTTTENANTVRPNEGSGLDGDLVRQGASGEPWLLTEVDGALNRIHLGPICAEALMWEGSPEPYEVDFDFMSLYPQTEPDDGLCPLGQPGPAEDFPNGARAGDILQSGGGDYWLIAMDNGWLHKIWLNDLCTETLVSEGAAAPYAAAWDLLSLYRNADAPRSEPCPRSLAGV